MAFCGKRVLVTGGAGFIGSHLVERLVECKNQVCILDNLSSGYESNIISDKAVSFVEGDVRDEKTVSSLVKECDVVFHLAEYIPNTASYGAGHVVKFSVENPLAEFDVSCRGSIVVLENVKDFSKKLVFCSTAAVYGEPNVPCVKETDATLPISPYGASKLCAETYVQLYKRIYDLPVVIVRFFNVYGPRQRKYVMYDTLCKLAKNPNELKILGTGAEERDFVYVKDAVDALLLVAENDRATGQIFNVGSGRSTSLRDLITLMVETLNTDPILTFTNLSWKGNVNRLCSDIIKLKQLGYEPTYSLQSGIKSLINWFYLQRNQGQNLSIIA